MSVSWRWQCHNVTMSEEAPGVADERLEQRPVSGSRTRARALDEERGQRTPDKPRGAVRVRGRRRRRRRGARRSCSVYRRCGRYEGLDDPGNAHSYDRARRCTRRPRARGRPRDLSLSVYQDYGVRRHFRVLCFQEILDGFVEVLCGRLFDEDRLGQRLRMRWRKLERREKRFRRWRFEFEV